jgi:hypothetical protein
MTNIILPIEMVVTEEEATALAPTGKLACGICSECHAIIPLSRMVVHDLKVHSE